MRLLRPLFLLVCGVCLVLSCGREEYSTGEAVYQGECIQCHRLEGKGGTKGPDLTNILNTRDTRFVRQYTIDPRSLKADGTMPPSKLSDREVDMLIEFLQNTARKHQSTPK